MSWSAWLLARLLGLRGAGRQWSGRVRWAGAVRAARGDGSGDESDAPIGVEQVVGGGPAVEDARDLLSGVAHEAGGGVPQLPAQRLGFGDRERARSHRAA